MGIHYIIIFLYMHKIFHHRKFQKFPACTQNPGTSLEYHLGASVIIWIHNPQKYFLEYSVVNQLLYKVSLPLRYFEQRLKKEQIQNNMYSMIAFVWFFKVFRYTHKNYFWKAKKNLNMVSLLGKREPQNSLEYKDRERLLFILYLL